MHGEHQQAASSTKGRQHQSRTENESQQSQQSVLSRPQSPFQKKAEKDEESAQAKEDAQDKLLADSIAKSLSLEETKEIPVCSSVAKPAKPLSDLQSRLEPFKTKKKGLRKLSSPEAPSRLKNQPCKQRIDSLERQFRFTDISANKKPRISYDQLAPCQDSPNFVRQVSNERMISQERPLREQPQAELPQPSQVSFQPLNLQCNSTMSPKMQQSRYVSSRIPNFELPVHISQRQSFSRQIAQNSSPDAKKKSEDDALDAIAAYEASKDADCLQGKLLALATCQIGSKFLQRIFSRSIRNLSDNLMSELLRETDRLMVDQYGNYFLQALIAQLDKRWLVRLIESIKHFNQVATNARGTHVLKCLVRSLKSATEQDAFIAKLKASGIQNLAKNQNGVHVIIELLNRVHSEDLSFILNFLQTEFLSVSKDKSGICLVKAALTKSHWLPKLSSLVIQNARQLAQDPFGNYALQNLLESRPEKQIALFSPDFLPDNLTALCLNKYSSNVLDKLIRNCSKSQMTQLLTHLTSQTSQTLLSLISSPYANYPLQNLLNEALGFRDQATKETFDKVLNKLEESINGSEPRSESAPQNAVNFKWLKLIAAFKRGEKSRENLPSRSRQNEQNSTRRDQANRSQSNTRNNQNWGSRILSRGHRRDRSQLSGGDRQRSQFQISRQPQSRGTQRGALLHRQSHSQSRLGDQNQRVSSLGPPPHFYLQDPQPNIVLPSPLYYYHAFDQLPPRNLSFPRRGSGTSKPYDPLEPN